MLNYGLSLVTPPAAEPVLLDEAKVQCGVAKEDAYHDGLLQGLIETARQKVETDTGRAIANQTWELTTDRFPSWSEPIYIPKVPLVSVESIKYFDVEGVEQTLATDVYKVLAGREPGEIRLKVNQLWPLRLPEPGVVTVRFVAGYGDKPPAGLKHAMLLLLHSLFDPKATGDVSKSYESLITTYLTGDEFHVYAR